LPELFASLRGRGPIVWKAILKDKAHFFTSTGQRKLTTKNLATRNSALLQLTEASCCVFSTISLKEQTVIRENDS
jgi:hypothetical protein